MKHVHDKPERLTLASLLLVVALGACHTSPDDVDATTVDPVNGAVINEPAGLLRLRASDPERLELVAELNGSRLTVEALPDGRRQVVFDEDLLDSSDTDRLTLTWLYNLGDRTVPVARVTRDVTRESDRLIAITANEFDTTFDDDNDGASNLSEINAGSNPVVAGDMTTAPPTDSTTSSVTPFTGQGDCRPATPEGFSLPTDSVPTIVLADASVESISPMPNSEDGNIIYLYLYTEGEGGLIIEHTGGLPLDTQAVFYARTIGNETTAPSDGVRILVSSDRGDGSDERARIPPSPTTTTRFRMSLLCYALFAPDDNGLPRNDSLQDTVIKISYQPK